MPRQTKGAPRRKEMNATPENGLAAVTNSRSNRATRMSPSPAPPSH